MSETTTPGVDKTAAGVDETGAGTLDDQFLTDVGTRLRRLRTDRGWTVQHLADRAGISRRLLTQIERGQANPSLVTMTRLARQVGTDFRALLDQDGTDTPVTVGGPAERRLVWSTPAGSTGELLQSVTGDRTVDLWRWRLAPGDSYQGQPDPAGSAELFHVLEGELTLSVGADRWSVPAGGSARLASDCRYAYENQGSEPVTFVRTVYLSR